jgi:hypothetical protein
MICHLSTTALTKRGDLAHKSSLKPPPKVIRLGFKRWSVVWGVVGGGAGGFTSPQGMPAT